MAIDFDAELGTTPKAAENGADLVSFLGNKEFFPASFSAIEEKDGQKVFVGVRLDSNEPIRVVLADHNGSAERAKHIATIVKNSTKVVNTGGTFLVEEAHADKSGVIVANWLKTAAVNKDDPVNIALRYVNINVDHGWVSALRAQDSVKIDDQAQLADVLKQVMTPAREGAWPFAVVRIVDVDGNVGSLHVISKKVDSSDKEAVYESAEETAARFMEEHGNKIGGWIASGDAKLVEVIPGISLRIGLESSRSLQEGKFKYGDKLKGMFKNVDDRRFEGRAYIPFYITVFADSHGRPKVNDAMRPVKVMPEIRLAAEIPTAHYAPEPVRHVAPEVALPHLKDKLGAKDSLDLSSQDMSALDDSGGEAPQQVRRAAPAI